MKKIDILKKTDLFKDIPELHLENISACFEQVQYESKFEIFSEGDEGDFLYVISKGKVSVILMIEEIGEEEVAILEPFDFFGEMALIDGGPRSASTYAFSNSEMLRISKADFEKITGPNAPAADIIFRNIINKLSKRIRNTSDKLNNFYLMDMGV